MKCIAYSNTCPVCPPNQHQITECPFKTVLPLPIWRAWGLNSCLSWINSRTGNGTDLLSGPLPSLSPSLPVVADFEPCFSVSVLKCCLGPMSSRCSPVCACPPLRWVCGWYMVYCFVFVCEGQRWEGWFEKSWCAKQTQLISLLRRNHIKNIKKTLLEHYVVQALSRTKPNTLM